MRASSSRPAVPLPQASTFSTVGGLLGRLAAPIMPVCFLRNVIKMARRVPLPQASTFTTVGALLGQLAALFPDPLLHTGGDEVRLECWGSDPRVRSWLEEHGMSGWVWVNTGCGLAGVRVGAVPRGRRGVDVIN